MNLMEGELTGGTFSGAGVSIAGLSGLNGRMALGFRAEDATVVKSGGEIDAPVYALELLGDATMLTVRTAGTFVSVKAHKDYRAGIGDHVSISVPAGICHLFDPETTARIEAR